MNDQQSNQSKPLAILGAGSYGAVIAELAESCGYSVVSYLDDARSKNGTRLGEVPVIGPVREALARLDRDVVVAVAIGDNAVRLRWLSEARQVGRDTPRLVSPHALVSPSAQIDSAVYLHPGCQVWTQVHVGFGSIMSPLSTVAHHTELGEGCFVAGGAVVGARIHVGKCAFFGQGSTTSTGVHLVADGTLVGAGAVIIRDTEPFGVYVGSPGKLIKYASRERTLTE